MSGYFVSYNFSSIRTFKFAYEHTIYDFFRWIHLNLTADAQKIIWKLVSFICQIEKENKFYVKWHELRKHAHSRLLKHYKSNLEITVPSKTFGMFLISEWISILPFHFCVNRIYTLELRCVIYSIENKQDRTSSVACVYKAKHKYSYV